MSAIITLTVTQGQLQGKEYVFQRQQRCTVGRAADCYLQLPGGLLNMDVSRHHCLLDIDPPHVRIRDCGSRNGTFVNGVLIGHREKTQAPEEIDPLKLTDLELKDGDEIRLGSTILRVGISGPATCVGCGCDIGGEQAASESDRPLCEWCRHEAGQAHDTRAASSV